MPRAIWGFFWAGVFGAFLTAFYTFRLIWLTFFGQEKTHAHTLSGISYALPLVVLLVLSTGLGALIHPPLANVLPLSVGETLVQAGQAHGKHTAEILAVGATLLGLATAFVLYVVNKGKLLTCFKASTFGGAVYHWCYHGLGFDALYDLLFVKPFLFKAKLFKQDPVDKTWNIWLCLMVLGNKILSKTQTGLLRSHAVSFALGLACVLILAMMMVV